MPFDAKNLANYPRRPGVYVMRSKSGVVLYVGKAKNIRARLSQYFQKGGDGRAMIPFLISKVTAIETIVTTDEKEALVLENNLIKKHRPRYNILLRDDKSYLCLAIDMNHPWPTVKIKRAYKTKKKKKERLFGPYPNPFSARAALHEIYRYFRLRQCSDRELQSRKRPCILYDMGRCPAPCTGRISSDAYREKVDRAAAFLSGERSDLTRHLKEEMHLASERLEFEKAAEILSQIKDLEKVRSNKSFVDNTTLGNCDVIGTFRLGDTLCLTTLIVRSGKLIGSEEEMAEEIAGEVSEVSELYAMQRLLSSFDPPDEIIARGFTSPSKVLEAWAYETTGRHIKITAPKRGIKARMLSLAEENAEANTSKRIEESKRAEITALALAEKLGISPPGHIECIDQSHLSGQGMVSAIVAYKNGQKHKPGYRKFSLRDTSPGDDVGGLKEALRRHYQKVSPNQLPDLLIVDGGQAQANAAASVLTDLGISTIEVIGLAKEQSRHDKGLSQEVVFLPDSPTPITLDAKSEALFFLQNIRDEAHRFVITFQKKKRSQGLVKSVLDDIEGIGPKKKAALLRHFGSIAVLKEASLEEIAGVRGISQKDAERILSSLH